MTRRRRPDNWAHIRQGDIISFDSKSSRSPTGTYVYGVAAGADGRHVVNGGQDGLIMERRSYRMRLNERGLTLAMMEPGGPLRIQPGSPDSLRGEWRARLTFDWDGKQPPTFTIEAMHPVYLLLRAHWNVRTTADLRDDTDLLLEAWGERPKAAPETPFRDPRAWRRYNPDTRQLEPYPIENVVYPDIAAHAPQNDHAFDQIDEHPDVVATLSGILGWIHDNRYDLDDPGQSPRQR